MKEKIERWYLMGLWTDKMVQNAVSKGVLTDEEADLVRTKLSDNSI